jgi:hypothetical protein
MQVVKAILNRYIKWWENYPDYGRDDSGHNNMGEIISIVTMPSYIIANLYIGIFHHKSPLSDASADKSALNRYAGWSQKTG